MVNWSNSVVGPFRFPVFDDGDFPLDPHSTCGLSCDNLKNLFFMGIKYEHRAQKIEENRRSKRKRMKRQKKSMKIYLNI